MITSSVIACMRGASANGRPTGQRSISRSVAVGDHLRVALDRLAVEGRQQQLALAHVARADRGQHRVRADDRPQRRLAGQRRRLLGLGREERAHVVGVAGDRPGPPGSSAAHAEDLAEPAPGAEDELDLALVEAQHLQPRGAACTDGGGSGRRVASAASIGPAGDGGASPTRPGTACSSASALRSATVLTEQVLHRSMSTFCDSRHAACW